MPQNDQEPVFSRLKRPLAMVAGAAGMMVLGLAIGRYFVAGNPVIDEGNHSDTADFAQSRMESDSSDNSDFTASTPFENSITAQLPAGGGLFDPDPPADIRLTQAELRGQQLAANTSDDETNDPASSGVIRPSSSIDLLDTDVFGSQVALADEQLRIGNYAAALQMYQLLTESTSGAMLAPLQFRLALCAELSGNFAEAIDAYQRVSGSSVALDWNGLAVLGEARCLIASQRFDVLQGDMLRRVLLDESSFTTPVRLELIHLIGRSFWAQIALTKTTDLLDDHTLVVPVWHPDPNSVLDDLSRLLARTLPAAEEPMLSVLQVSEPNPGGIYLKIHSAPASISKLLAGILQRCELQLDISESAQRAIQNRRMTLHMNDRNLSLILDALTIPFGNVWFVDEEGVRIVAFSEMKEDALQDFRRSAAERVLRVALLEAGDSPQAGHSRLAMGMLQFDQGRVADATYTFRSQMEKLPRSNIQTETSFNIGKCLLKLRDAEEARRAFLYAVDTSGGPADLKVAAYMYAGRLQIELGDTKGAIGRLVRALRMSQETALEPQTALLLASNYLMIGNPAGTNSILMERREALNDPRYKYAGAFLSSAAQLQAAVLPTHREREGRDVVEAITQFAPETQFGAHWCLLVGEAAEDLGLTETATSSYLKTLSQEPAAPLRNQVMLKLATRYRLDDRLDEARKLLSSLGPQEAAEFSRLASLRSAEIALQQGRPDDTIALCRKLLEGEVPSDVRRAVLRVMGQAYEKQKNYQAAVYCFSGAQAPDLIDQGSESGPPLSNVSEDGSNVPLPLRDSSQSEGGQL